MLGACRPAAGPRPGQAFPGFELPRLQGGRVASHDHAGRALLINTWASWCGPCRAEMRQLQRLSEGLVSGLVVLGISLDADVRLAEEYVRREGLSFPNAWEGRDRFAAHVLGVRSLPETFLVGADGVLLLRTVGARAWDSGESVAGLAGRIGAPASARR